jgi:hypothetical protein
MSKSMLYAEIGSVVISNLMDPRVYKATIYLRPTDPETTLVDVERSLYDLFEPHKEPHDSNGGSQGSESD